jgi:hypothetical protein
MTFGNGLHCLLFIASALAAGSAKAQGDGSGAASGPPPEMVEACNGSAAGDACTVTLKGRTFDGTCRPGPTSETPLACLPKGPPPGVPMREAADACNGRAAGDVCSFTFPDRTIDGTCQLDPHRDGSLVCLVNPRRF